MNHIWIYIRVCIAEADKRVNLTKQMEVSLPGHIIDPLESILFVVLSSFFIDVTNKHGSRNLQNYKMRIGLK